MNNKKNDDDNDAKKKEQKKRSNDKCQTKLKAKHTRGEKEALERRDNCNKKKRKQSLEEKKMIDDIKTKECCDPNGAETFNKEKHCTQEEIEFIEKRTE